MTESEYDALVEALAERETRSDALKELFSAGPLAVEALRRGLQHPYASVRVGCCRVLDHHLDERAIPELVANVNHKNKRVRAWALHALACDRCKEGECRPGEDESVALAMERLVSDPSRRVRQMAAGLLGPAAERRDDVRAALLRAAEEDPHPNVRMIASWSVG